MKLTFGGSLYRCARNDATVTEADALGRSDM
jgi:hypothetical protein